jgi:RNA polymerase sigma-70 factor (ECF subfamily)
MLMVQRSNRLAGFNLSMAGSEPAVQIGAFEALFTQCEADVQAFIFTLLPHWANAEDVLQRTRIVLWQKFSQFQPGSNFKAWALQVARFEVANFRRRQRSDRHQFGDALIDSLAEVRSSLAEELERRRTALEQCVRKLRPSDRQIIRHCYGPKATTTKAAADRLHRPVNTLYKALQRIRRSLMDCVNEVTTDDLKGPR